MDSMDLIFAGLTFAALAFVTARTGSGGLAYFTAAFTGIASLYATVFGVAGALEGWIFTGALLVVGFWAERRASSAD